MHSAFIRVTGLLLKNNEIVQSILSTYMALRTNLQALNSRMVVWHFAILRESLNIWLYYVTFVCCLTFGYFTSLAAAVLVPAPPVFICHAQRPSAQALRQCWPICSLNAPCVHGSLKQPAN